MNPDTNDINYEIPQKADEQNTAVTKKGRCFLMDKKY